MINISNHNWEICKIEFYDKNGKYQRKTYPKEVIIPLKRKPKNNDCKVFKDVYTKKDYYIKSYPYNNTSDAKLTIPYKIHKNKKGFFYYDWSLGLKLLHFDEIINDFGVSFPNYRYYDIETTSLEPGEGIVTSVVFIDKDENTRVFLNDDGDERKLLMNIAKYLKKEKVLSLIGFNSKKFDDEYLSYRMRVNDVKYEPIMNSNIDIMLMANKLFISGSLASMAKQLGVIEKIELEDNPVKLFYDGDFDTLVEYNIRDVEVTKAISEKLNILDFCEALWKLSWCDFRHLNANSILNDCYFNKRMWEDGVLVSKANLEYLGAYSGGFNMWEADECVSK